MRPRGSDTSAPRTTPSPATTACSASICARAGAWVIAARGELSAAAAEAQRAADTAAERNAWALAVLALHDVARFGQAGDVAERLETLARVVDGEFVRCVAAHARALVDDDGPALDAVAHSSTSLTFDLFAAEASAAARARTSARRQARERLHFSRAPRTARRPLRVGPDARARVGRPTRRPHGTRREIADLARADLTSREIAERLGITTRTVDNLLGRVYVKLGVSGRQELADALGRRAL